MSKFCESRHGRRPSNRIRRCFDRGGLGWFVRQTIVTCLVGMLVCLPGMLWAQGELPKQPAVVLEAAKPAVPPAPAPPPERLKGRPSAPADPIKGALDTLKALLRKPAVPVPGVGVAVPAPPGVAPDALAVQRKAMILNQVRQMNLKSQIRPMVESEYWFLRAACDPTKDQRVPIAKAAFQCLDKMEVAYGEWMFMPRAAQVVNGVVQRQERPSPPDLLGMLRADLMVAAKQSLTPRQVDKYAKEIKARNLEERESLILQLASLLKSSVALDQAQENQLRTDMVKHWREPWRADLRINMNMSYYYMPKFPEEIVKPILSEKQWELLNSNQKYEAYYSFGVRNLMSGLPVEDLDEEFKDETVDRPSDVKGKP